MQRRRNAEKDYLHPGGRGSADLRRGLALAAGFSIYEAGSKATALGCAFTATADDGSALFYNAAGLIVHGRVARRSQRGFRGPQVHVPRQAEQDRPQSPPPGKPKTRSTPCPVSTTPTTPADVASFGIGVYAPFGLGVVWKDGENWVGRRISHDVQIQTVYVTPAVSLKVAEGLPSPLGIDIATQHLELKKYSPEPQFGENAIHTTIKGRSNLNLTPTLGLMYRPNEKLSLGVRYHFKKTMKFDDADATLEPVAPGDDPWGDALVGALGSDQKLIFRAEPARHPVAGHRLPVRRRKFKAEFNYVRFGWSTFEKLALDFDNDALDQTIHFNYEDSWQIRFGFDYQASEKLNLMAGYVHDKTPQPLAAVSPLLPDSDRNDYSFGAHVQDRQLGLQRQLHGRRRQGTDQHRKRRAGAQHRPTIPSVPTNPWPTCSGSAWATTSRRRCRK